MAATLVDIDWAPTCKLRVLNPFPTFVDIKQNAVLGQTESVLVAKTYEYDVEQDDKVGIRRLDLNKWNSVKTELHPLVT